MVTLWRGWKISGGVNRSCKRTIVQVGIRASLLAVAVFAAGCTGSSTTSPSPTAPGGSTALYTLSGVVSAPTGGAVPGVRVQVGGKSTTTDDAGRYTVGELSGSFKIQISKDGYETQEARAVLGGDRVVNVTLPPVVRISAGGMTTVTLYPTEPTYLFPIGYEECSAPCKIIRVLSPGPGTLSITLTARDPNRKLTVLIYEGTSSYCCAAQITFGPLGIYFPGEFVLYVTAHGGVAGVPQDIDISTSFRTQ